jgi:hypothetical protein
VASSSSWRSADARSPLSPTPDGVPPLSSGWFGRPVDAELPQKVAVLFGVDSVWELLVSLVCFVVITTVAQQLKNLVLGDLHDFPLLR